MKSNDIKECILMRWFRGIKVFRYVENGLNP